MSDQIPNSETMMSIEEAIDDLKEHRLPGATSVKLPPNKIRGLVDFTYQFIAE